ncbi:MAG: glycosyltransferase family 4 protein [Pseudomonadota bacterium]
MNKFAAPSSPSSPPSSSGTVLIVSVDAFPKMGGISTMTHHVANALVATGCRVLVIAPRGSYVPGGFSRSYELCEDWESDIAARDGPGAEAEDRRIETLTKGLIAQEQPAEIILMHGFYYGTGVLRAAQAAGVPAKIVVHGTELTSQLGCTAGRDRSRADPASLGARFRDCLRQADGVLANSRHTAGLVRHLAGVDPVGVIGVGVPADRLRSEMRGTPERCAQQQAARRRSFGLPDGPVFAYIGRLARHKRVDRLLRLTAACPDATCMIGGDGPELSTLIRLGEHLGLGDRLRLLGPLSEQHKWRALRAADFSALMSSADPETGAYEGFGIGLLEAVTAGAVPLSTGADGMADFMSGDPPPGLLLPAILEDPAADAARLYALWRDPERMDRMIARGRGLIAAQFTWDRVAARIMSHVPIRDTLPLLPLRHAV